MKSEVRVKERKSASMTGVSDGSAASAPGLEALGRCSQDFAVIGRKSDIN